MYLLYVSNKWGTVWITNILSGLVFGGPSKWPESNFKIGLKNGVRSTDRIMFGSDSIENTSIEIAQYKKLKLFELDLENIFYKVAEKIFLLQ